MISWPLAVPKPWKPDLGGEQGAVGRELAAERLGARLGVGGGELADLRAVGVEERPTPAAATAGRCPRRRRSAPSRRAAKQISPLMSAPAVGRPLDEHVLGEAARADRVDVVAAEAVALGGVQQHAVVGRRRLGRRRSTRRSLGRRRSACLGRCRRHHPEEQEPRGQPGRHSCASPSPTLSAHVFVPPTSSR